MSDPSSLDRTPSTGARVWLERIEGGSEYRVDVYLAGGARVGGRLAIEDEVRLVLDDPAPTGLDQWVADEVLKLARVLKRTPKTRLTRWRPKPE
jgi:hypothetical protein